MGMRSVTLLILVRLYISYALSIGSSKVEKQQQQVLILGFGPVARAVARELSRQCPSGKVLVTTRRQDNPESQEHLTLIDFSRESVASNLDATTHLLVTVPAPKSTEGEDSTRQAVQECIAEQLPPTAWVGLVSTTGVFGNHDDAWVTEESECKDPNHPYLLYEEEWRQISRDRIFRIFRSAGLYGPERSALHTVYAKGYSDTSPALNPVLTNRIHEDDVARAIVASMTDGNPSYKERVYNLSDDEPEARAIVMQHAARLLEDINVSVHDSEVDANAFPSSPRSRRRGTERKRVSNKRAKAELVDEWKYPTYREGLAAILENQAAPWWQRN